MLLERDVAQVERRLRPHRENAPKRRICIATSSRIGLGRPPVQLRLVSLVRRIAR
jgi:hypothetical protein